MMKTVALVLLVLPKKYSSNSHGTKAHTFIAAKVLRSVDRRDSGPKKSVLYELLKYIEINMHIEGGITRIIIALHV